MKALHPHLFNSSPSVFSSKFSKMGVWHQLPVQICYRHSLPWRQQTLSGWQPLPQTRGEYFWNHPNSRRRTSCYKHTDTSMAAKMLFSFFLKDTKKKKINNRECSQPFIHFSGLHIFGRSLAFHRGGADRNFVFPFQVCQQHKQGFEEVTQTHCATRVLWEQSEALSPPHDLGRESLLGGYFWRQEMFGWTAVEMQRGVFYT